MKLRIILLLVLPLMAFICEAYAGSFKNGNWSPSACGAIPEPPQTDFGDITAYNQSIDNINTYAQRLSVYQSCVVKEANSDMRSITQSANSAQQTAKAVDDAYQAQLEKTPKRFQRSNNAINLPFNRANTEAPCNCTR